MIGKYMYENNTHDVDSKVHLPIFMDFKIWFVAKFYYEFINYGFLAHSTAYGQVVM